MAKLKSITSGLQTLPLSSCLHTKSLIRCKPTAAGRMHPSLLCICWRPIAGHRLVRFAAATSSDCCWASICEPSSDAAPPAVAGAPATVAPCHTVAPAVVAAVVVDTWESPWSLQCVVFATAMPADLHILRRRSCWEEWPW
eukprot:CAMPEP_0172833142 /NCGR_PEP_ID=MMETSP1075-20121228/24158_1 /TAXON_ID=2916 /ORGANISM="Ceratium fusus, Strain PA161109" /LENGTH=140 /DNA_ID=CAMNT_0013675847 /DNA_START=622 /DNA_END=1041 /DNA_ORIENTATION=-